MSRSICEDCVSFFALVSVFTHMKYILTNVIRFSCMLFGVLVFRFRYFGLLSNDWEVSVIGTQPTPPTQPLLTAFVCPRDDLTCEYRTRTCGQIYIYF